jgi:hypothetical protein
MEYITASCTIRDHIVYTNEKAVFEQRPAALPAASVPPAASMPAALPPAALPPATLPEFLAAAYHHFGLQYPKFYKMDNLSKLGWLASELLLKEGFKASDYRPEEIAVVLSNSNASLDTDYKYFATIKDIPSPAVFVYTLPNIMIGEICIRHKFKGENAFFIFKSFDAAFIEQYVRGLMENENARACICGWADVLGEEYAAALFLIEKKQGMPFSAENMNRILSTKYPA